MHGLVAFCVTVATIAAGPGQKGEFQWFKGNLHTHTWWSDGDSPPETVIAWYKNNGYQFLALTDHNQINVGNKWVSPDKNKKSSAAAAGAEYAKQYGPRWVETKPESQEPGAATLWRAKPLSEVRALFEEAGKFLLIPGDEISIAHGTIPVHLNGFNLLEAVPNEQADTVTGTLQKAIDDVMTQSQSTGTKMLVQINHPNFKWALTAEDIFPTRGAALMEVANGHNGVNNAGDREHPSVEHIWDVVLTKRLGELNMPILYGTATDDAHFFGPGADATRAIAGRGWVMVRARYLTPEHVLRALEQGDFYASSGVTLDEVQFENNVLSLKIQPKPGVSYRTQFIGTLRGYDPKATPRTSDPEARLTMKYSNDVGKVLAEQSGTEASYKLTGQELYVRARVVSTAKKENPAVQGDLEMAWVQPVRPQTGK